jgi:hypothetical protein
VQAQVPDLLLTATCQRVLLNAVLLLSGCEPPALASVRVSSRVLGLTWLSQEEQQLDVQGRSLLAVLHEMTGAICHGLVDDPPTCPAVADSNTPQAQQSVAACASCKRISIR